ncbi:MAG TPA: hypothetical protein VJ873_12905 [bacterium]|nr:hypothetical protein [bacterium]
MGNQEQGTGKGTGNVGDFFIGILCFVGSVILALLLAKIGLGLSFLGILILGFIWLLIVSIQAGRPGLILGYIGSIILSVGALFILIWSICGGGKGWGH